MGNDEFLDGLRSDWQSEKADMSGVVQALEEKIAKARRQKWLRLGGACAFAVMAVAFGWSAWQIKEPLFHVGAVAFLVAMLLTLGDFLVLRKITAQDYLSDFRSLLNKAEQQAQAAVALEKAALAACMLLSICAVFALVYAFAGTQPMWKSLTLAVVWAGASVAMYFRQSHRSAVAEAELEKLTAMHKAARREGL